MKFCDYYNSHQSEGSLEEFLSLTKSGNLNFDYIENAEYPANFINLFDVKWKLSQENYIHNRLDDLAGVTKPTLYVGSQYSTFPWHKEDGDLRSLSLLLAGSDKVN